MIASLKVERERERERERESERERKREGRRRNIHVDGKNKVQNAHNCIDTRRTIRT